MKKLLVIGLLLVSLSLSAQDSKYKISDEDYSNNSVEMADVMRSNGKIYVVVGVIFLIFVGISFYVYRIDKKVSALEKEIQNSGE